MLRENVRDGMEHFRAPTKQAKENSIQLMSFLREEVPDSTKIYAKIDEIAEVQKKLQQAVIDTVLAKISAMSNREKKQYLDDFENWLFSYH